MIPELPVENQRKDNFIHQNTSRQTYTHFPLFFSLSFQLNV